MPQHHLGFLSSDNVDGRELAADVGEFDAARRDAMQASDDPGVLAAAARDQLQREFAAIERAAAALRRGEPELESWTSPPAAMTHKPRPVWLLIGVLWLSTALATISAVFVISALVG